MQVPRRPLAVSVVTALLVPLLAMDAAGAAPRPSAGRWTPGPDLGRPRAAMAAAPLADGSLLVAGGVTSWRPGSVADDAELLRPDASAWAPAGRLPTSLSAATATLLVDGSVLVSGGRTPTGPAPNAYRYRPAANAWTTTGRMVNQDRTEHTATLLRDGRVLVAAGLAHEPRPGYLADAELYDPRTDRWSGAAPLHYGRFAHTAARLPDGRVLVVGGYGGGRSAEAYDPAGDRWTDVTPMPLDMGGVVGVALADGRLLVVGDATRGAVFDPRTGGWTVTASRPAAVCRGCAATLLHSGLVLVAGGDDGRNPSNPVREAVLYDPVTNGWLPAPPLREARYEPAWETARSGVVVVAGGVAFTNGGPDVHSLRSTELFRDAPRPRRSRTPALVGAPDGGWLLADERFDGAFEMTRVGRDGTAQPPDAGPGGVHGTAATADRGRTLLVALDRTGHAVTRTEPGGRWLRLGRSPVAGAVAVASTGAAATAVLRDARGAVWSSDRRGGRWSVWRKVPGLRGAGPLAALANAWRLVVALGTGSARRPALLVAERTGTRWSSPRRRRSPVAPVALGLGTDHGRPVLVLTGRDGAVLVAAAGGRGRLVARPLGVRGDGGAAAASTSGRLLAVVLGRDGRYLRHVGTAPGGWLSLR